MRVLPKIGFDDVRLGMDRDAIRGLLGQPSSVSAEKWPDGVEEESWDYTGVGVTLSFSDDDDYRLGRVTFEGTDLELEGVQVIGRPIQEALRVLQEAGVPSFSLEDNFEEIGMQDYTCPDLELSIWVEDGIVRSVTLLPEFDDAGQKPIWPEATAG